MRMMPNAGGLSCLPNKRAGAGLRALTRGAPVAASLNFRPFWFSAGDHRRFPDAIAFVGDGDDLGVVQ